MFINTYSIQYTVLNFSKLKTSTNVDEIMPAIVPYLGSFNQVCPGKVKIYALYLLNKRSNS